MPLHMQIESGVFDGVYFQCSVEENLNRFYNFPPEVLTGNCKIRFANFKRKVFKNIHPSFFAVIQNRSGLEAANTHIRNKAEKATELHRRILNLDFLLTHSGLTGCHL